MIGMLIVGACLLAVSSSCITEVVPLIDIIQYNLSVCLFVIKTCILGRMDVLQQPVYVIRLEALIFCIESEYRQKVVPFCHEAYV